MRKTRILISSVLKPVNDTRMYEKFAQSLIKLPGNKVHIAGFGANAISNSPDIIFHPVFSFPRLSLGRIAAQWKYYKLLLELKPEVVIVNTFELLPVTLLYRIFSSTEILYDVRENYYANIRFQPTFPQPLRWFLANAVRLIEKATAPFIRHFFLAEKAYAEELGFLGENYTVLENKFKPVSEFPVTNRFPVRLSGHDLHFLYSGTITEIYGIWEAIKLVEKLHQAEPAVTLTIIGYCPQEKTFQELQQAIADKPYVNLLGGNKLVPHALIIEEIRKATVGLLPYKPNPSTSNCIPTKLYEYLAHGLPVLIPENPLWQKTVTEHGAGLAINFQIPAPENILNRLISGTFYPGGIPTNVFWQQEEEKLLTWWRNNL